MPDDDFGQALPQTLNRLVVVDQCRNKGSKLPRAGIVCHKRRQGSEATRTIMVRMGVDEGLEQADVLMGEPTPGALEVGAGGEAA